MPHRLIAFLAAALAFAQQPERSEQLPPVPSPQSPVPATMKQLMLDLIHPASNEILLLVNRGGPGEEKEWAAARRNALTLAESGTLLVEARRAGGADWAKDAKLLSDAGAAAYKAALAKDAKALAASAESLDAACTACHKQYRPDVFPRQGGSQ